MIFYQKYKKFVLWFFLIPGLLIIGACKKKPKDVLSENKTVSLMTDLELADAYVRVYGNDGRNLNEADKKEVVDQVLKEHKISRKQYDATMNYYGYNIDEYIKVQEKVEKELQKRENKFEEKEKVNQQRPEDELWQYGRNAQISPLSPQNGFLFSFKPDELESGQSLEWKMRIDRGEYLSAFLGVDYEDGTSNYINQNFSTTHINLNLDTDEKQKVKRIYGYLRLYSPVSSPLLIDSISLIHRDLSGANANGALIKFYSPDKSKRQKVAEKKNEVRNSSESRPAIQDNRQIQTADQGISVEAN